jgi:hypothetical protein
MTSFGVARLDGRDRVAGVDRAGERVRRFHREHVGNLHHIEQGGDARRDVLACRRGRRDEGIVVPHQPGDQRRDIFGKRVLVGRIVRNMHLADAGDGGGLLRDRRTFEPATIR